MNLWATVSALVLVSLLSPALSRRPINRCHPPVKREDARLCCSATGIGCIPRGGKCTKTRFNPLNMPCEEGLTCVVSNFGKPSIRRDSRGRCRKLKVRPKRCTIEKCSRTGQKTICRISGVIATCGAWAKRTDSGPKPECPRFCTRLLQIPRPKGSDGRLYGNVGCLIVASCRSNFKIYGPVKRDASDICAKPISSLLGPMCCNKYKMECAEQGERCTNRPLESLLSPKVCRDGLTCVIPNPDDGRNPPEGKCELRVES